MPLIAVNQPAGIGAKRRTARHRRHGVMTVLSIDWEPDGDELTATMKLKRHRIVEKYWQEIDALYTG
jgi:long-subunit acyl-CoA synthetase (AMP-forming)